MDDICSSDAVAEQAKKSTEGSCRVSFSGFDFYRKNLGFGLASVRNQKIDFNVISVFFFMKIGIGHS